MVSNVVEYVKDYEDKIKQGRGIGNSGDHGGVVCQF